MRRREFITTLLGGAVAAWPVAAQEPDRVRRIGALMSFTESDPEGQARIAAFRESLGSLGWIEGRNISVDVRWATSTESIRQFATELVALQPELILSATTPTTTSLRQQTLVIPIVFANVSDPVGSGFVASLSRPGGNTTGFINLEDSMAGKWLGLLKEIAPQACEVAFVFNPTTAPYAEYYLNPFKAAARSLGVGAIPMPVSSSSGLESAIAGQARDLKGGPIVMPDSLRG
jgi:putative tryptophan/tyrosine transport system substrate-binding protein